MTLSSASVNVDPTPTHTVILPTDIMYPSQIRDPYRRGTAALKNSAANGTYAMRPDARERPPEA